MPLDTTLRTYIIYEWEITPDTEMISDIEMRLGLANLFQKIASVLLNDKQLDVTLMRDLKIYTEQCGWKMKLIVRCGEKNEL